MLKDIHAILLHFKNNIQKKKKILIIFQMFQSLNKKKISRNKNEK